MLLKRLVFFRFDKDVMSITFSIYSVFEALYEILCASRTNLMNSVC